MFNVNADAPSGAATLRDVESVARGLDRLDRNRPSLASEFVIPEYDVSSRNLWPPRRVRSFGAEVAASMVPMFPGVNADWGSSELAAARRAEIAKGQRELGSHYEKLSADQQERMNAKARAAMGR